LRDRKTVKSW